MDLESELRKAMAERVAEATAPDSLAADVKRRHRRRAARIRVTVGAAAAAVAAIALVPTYQSFRATPAGAPGTAAPPDRASVLRQPERPPARGVPTSPSPSGRPGTGTSPKPPDARPSGGTGGHTARPGAPGGVPALPGWVSYLPRGLTATAPCAVADGAGRKTTTCAWRGSAGWVEIAVVRDSGLGPEDLAPMRGVPGHASVRGMPALTADAPDSGRQISWLARPGVGVVVKAGGGTARNELLRIAEGVRP
ncbi:hypothetical protein [Actinomadura fibrosa]|uniref:DUF2020 domain-containing protein n=1 Tax=Actinomadura fibrosa TaxID=111802 RepID=A0ABW2XGQ1_9ACTN|nr:hypothetical protein [Actinomadura fibrosa]